jgi:F-type H+-transporting ATPase subunit c
MDAEVMKMLAVGMAAGLGMLGPALGLGLVGYGALTGISRNPEAAGSIFTNMILVAAFIEALGIYVLIIGIIMSPLMS